MVGHTAQTVDSRTPLGTSEDRAFFGLIKVLPIHKLDAGVSYWGWAKMPPNTSNGVWMDWWLQDFINKKRSDYTTLDDFVQLLEAELQRLVPPLEEKELEIMPLGSGGIHVAGFTETNGMKVPCFWHIHNGISQALPGKKLNPHIVNANCDWQPKRFHELKERSYVTRNGEIEAYATFFEEHLQAYTGKLYDKMKMIVPLPTIVHRAEFWSSQIKFISALYEVGGLMKNGVIKPMIKSIGDQVTTLTITPDGIRDYYTR